MIKAKLEEVRGRGEMALIPYLTAGYPSLEESLIHLNTISDNGADLIELGVPFSDPIADGPTIQHASHVALQARVSLRRVLDALRSVPLRQPLILMSYLNPLMCDERRMLLANMRRAGVVGLIVPDLPLEEVDDWLAAARAEDIAMILMASMTSTDARVREIGLRTDAFVYAISVTGTTGTRSVLDDGLGVFLQRVRRVAGKPVVVGFGISTPEHVRALYGQADGVVVGSRIVAAIQAQEDLATLVRTFKDATRS